MSFSPPPPPQAARAFVRLLFRRGGGAPVVAATVLDDAVSGSSSLELVNEGGRADDVACLAATVAGMRRVAVGALAPGETASVPLGAPTPRDVHAVTTATDESGRMHVWSYDGRHRRLRRHERLSLDDAFRRMYPGRRD